MDKRILIATIFVLSLVGTASATNWSVDDDGEADFTGIQDAINNASAGDTILVYSGVYYENVVVDKSVTLRGIGHPVVDGRRSGSAVALTADGITLEGFRVTSCTLGVKVISNHNNITGNTICNNDVGISLYKSSNNTITGNTLVNDGLLVDESYQNTVEDNTVNGKPLVYLEDVSNYKIEDAGQIILVNCSNITAEYLDISNISVGIELWGTEDSTISNNKVCNNRCGIRLKSSGNNSITDNNVSDNNDDAIHLASSGNNIIKGNNVCNNNDYGIYLYSSSNNTIKGNNVCNNKDGGIYLASSGTNSITGNTVCHNHHEGIDLDSSSNCTITGNKVSNNNNIGIYLYSSSNNTITANNVRNNSNNGIVLSSSSDNNTITGNTFVNDGLLVGDPYQNTVENNTVNGKPLVYLEDVSNYKVEDAGQVILVNCTNITVKNMDLSNTSVGIELWETVDGTIINNTICNNNRYGIRLKSSGNNSITGNTLCHNEYDGIDLSSSSNNTITGNNVSNNKCGIDLSSSCNNTITGNTVSHNSYDGIELDDSGNNNISGNNVSNNSDGIYLYSSSKNNIAGNTVCHNNDGICLHSSNNNTITGNNVSNHWVDISILESRNNTLTGNTFVNAGLFVAESYQNTVEGNTVNGKPLIYLEDASDYRVEDAGQVILVNCSNITVENLDLSNTSVGVDLLETEDCIISNNTLNSNNWGGIRLWFSSNNTITSNNVSNNNRAGAIVLGYSSNNNIIDNIVSNNKGEGVGIGLLGYSSNNNITGNTVCNNSYGGIVLSYSSNNNTITGNNVSNNWWGIFIWGSIKSTITGNNVCNNTHGGESLVGDASGIFLQFSSNSTITGNTVCNNDEGIYLLGSTNNIIRGNSASNNGDGIYLNTSSSNKIFLNNFVNNINNAHSYKSTNIWNSTEEITYTQNGSTFTNYLGNYWGDYEERYPDADEINTTGIWDTPYSIDGDEDNYPLMERFENYLTFETIRKGHFSGHNERENYVITNNNDWENLWNKTYSKSPKPSLPEIDFTQNMVIAVFQGVHSTGGYDIEIIKIDQESIISN